MRRFVKLSFVLACFWLPNFGCSDSNNNPVSREEDTASDETTPQTPIVDRTFGVSGLLFENNLVMWFRGNDGTRSELFPQMYFTRIDAHNYPVWGTFPGDSMVFGGVERDGIPALVRPRFVTPDSREADYLEESDLVLGVVMHGEAKAYSENVLWWHEVANDVIGGEEVIMTLCPLTGTGMLFKRPADANTVDQLELLPVIETTWEKWQELYPETSVLSDHTGHDRNYAVYPYGGYRAEDTTPLFTLLTGEVDRRFPPKHTVLGLLASDTRKAYPFSKLESNPVVNDEVNGLHVLVVSEMNARLAIPYDRQVGERVLTFSLLSENLFRMTDNQTGSVWNIKGEALSGELEGSRLTQLPAHNAYWFAWAIFWPQTLVFDD